MRRKQITYIIGLLASIVVSISYLLIMLRWPVGRSIFNYAFLVLVLVFVPLMGYDYYQTNIVKNPKQKLKITLGFSSAFISGIGVAFKLLHLVGANVLFGVGVLLFAIGFLPLMFYRLYQNSAQRIQHDS